MQREIITTADGSRTIQIKDWDEQYHSKHGAIQEAYHVFIKHGLDLFQGKKESVHILEIGFGTGLNALITLLETSKSGLYTAYYGIEAYPVSPEELAQLNYIPELKAHDFQEQFTQMHSSPWEKQVAITDNFSLCKKQCDFKEIDFENCMDLIYFDAFGARVQPELWTEDVFELMFRALKVNGVLVTYAAKGSVRRAMQAVGFEVERLPGPPGKREMLRAKKVGVNANNP
ncbi:tRNA (5-methylaminomethyl-2-thiouridine)(34)-methyltransferase MnmD [Maribacter polysiphoniae]|uniref:tRNA (5-methylaminomethyl-2-thiouridine)(34)-methyltransferase MnmD n=1 Tax=Maribacter polysiphoniae TaxID=429344 RepID=A0A316E3Y8_9FLAO|nr:tRNA (5-methylaminomethyl-2-thiouridine)(34)-methyltransferase MnmD [Maribacter polysiphoniae]MBD1259228.1 tRNA (5-methylaminomethyl-2-thiouridine)(34)-methyltransferase MnmD [Maribacter polysiphoniae]PWK24785.1 tRNA U34 5-methylaminomethyl-2-thiouridine-forming methyltransferase MnmC [Maribacter polysiphoniae]